MGRKALKIVLTGPESTGKSSLGRALSRHFSWPLLGEYARGYLEINGPSYGLDDLKRIAAGQIEAEKAMAAKKESFFADSDLLTIRIWLDDKFGLHWPFLDAHLKAYPAGHYLLLYPDIPWEPDPLREDPERRLFLFERYLAEIRQIERPYTIIRGTGPRREKAAIRAVEEILKQQ